MLKLFEEFNILLNKVENETKIWYTHHHHITAIVMNFGVDKQKYNNIEYTHVI